jgi:hypothetical protein
VLASLDFTGVRLQPANDNDDDQDKDKDKDKDKGKGDDKKGH